MTVQEQHASQAVGGRAASNERLPVEMVAMTAHPMFKELAKAIERSRCEGGADLPLLQSQFRRLVRPPCRTLR